MNRARIKPTRFQIICPYCDDANIYSGETGTLDLYQQEVEELEGKQATCATCYKRFEIPTLARITNLDHDLIADNF